MPLWPVFPHSSAHAGTWMAPLPGVRLCCSLALPAHREALLDGVLPCILAHQVLKGAPWVGSCFVVQCVRCLMGQPLYCSAADAGMWGKRGYSDGSTPTRDSAVLLCFHSCPAFLHRHFPPQSPPLTPLDQSLRSHQQPSPWDCSTIPKLQLPATAPSRELASLSRVSVAGARTICFSFHLDCHRSTVSPSALNVSPLT